MFVKAVGVKCQKFGLVGRSLGLEEASMYGCMMHQKLSFKGVRTDPAVLPQPEQPHHPKGKVCYTHLIFMGRLISDVRLFSHETHLNVHFWNNISSLNLRVLQQLSMLKYSACNRLTALRVK